MNPAMIQNWFTRVALTSGVITEPCWKPDATTTTSHTWETGEELITTIQEYVDYEATASITTTPYPGSRRMDTWPLLHGNRFLTTLQHSRTSRRWPVPHFSSQRMWKTYNWENLISFQNPSYTKRSGKCIYLSRKVYWRLTKYRICSSPSLVIVPLYAFTSKNTCFLILTNNT